MKGPFEYQVENAITALQRSLTEGEEGDDGLLFHFIFDDGYDDDGNAQEGVLGPAFIFGCDEDVLDPTIAVKFPVRIGGKVQLDIRPHPWCCLQTR